MFVVFIGPDGSGKTTVAKSLCLAKENSIYFHYIPLKKNINNFESINNVKKEIKKSYFKVFLSIPKLIFKVIFVNILCKIKFFKWKKEYKYIIGDRFLYNFYLDPSTLEYYSSKNIAKYFIEKVLIKPDLIIYLQTTPENILLRKKELTYDQIKNFDKNVLELDINNLKTINANHNFQKVMDQVGRLIDEKYL